MNNKIFLKIFPKKVLTIYDNSYYTIKAVGKTETKSDKTKHGILAQLGEHLPYKQRVTGSSPVGPMINKLLVSQTISYGGIAQLARAHGSYPWCREFKSPFRYSFKL